MSSRVPEADFRVDAFVEAVNSSPHEVLFREEIPEACLQSEAEWPGAFHWQMAHSTDADWLAEVEHRLPFSLPPAFRSLLARYLFPSFAAGPLTFYSVGVRSPDSHGMEFRVAIFADRYMCPFLFKNGLLPFARPADVSYDPVCFDFRSSHRKSEPAVVRIDHEEILCNDRLRVREVISPAFDVLIAKMTKDLRSKASPDA